MEIHTFVLALTCWSSDKLISLCTLVLTNYAAMPWLICDNVCSQQVNLTVLVDIHTNRNMCIQHHFASYYSANIPKLS